MRRKGTMGVCFFSEAESRSTCVANPALLFCSMVMSDAEEPYNPLDLRRLGEGIARALLARPVSPLPPAKGFFGSGIYAIYYTGDFSPYEPIAERNRGA